MQKVICKGSTTFDYFFGNNIDSLQYYAWYKPSFGEISSKPVGLKLPNQFGLFDIYGNAAEWCYDYYDANYYDGRRSPDINPQGPKSIPTQEKVIRGGSFNSNSADCRSAKRDYKRIDESFTQ